MTAAAPEGAAAVCWCYCRRSKIMLKPTVFERRKQRWERHSANASDLEQLWSCV